MSAATYTSAVLILPAAYRQAGNDLSASMGWQPVDADPGTYSIPLCTDGVLTHWGCRADVTQGFIGMVENPPQDAAALVAVLVYDWRVTGDPHQHFLDVISGLGLTTLPDEVTQ